MLLEVSKISKYFAGEPLFCDVSFSVEAGDVLGLVGVNGSGKSTLLKIITGEIDFDKNQNGEGEIRRKSGLKIGFLHQNSGLVSNASINEEMQKPFDELHKVLSRMKELEQSYSEENAAEYARLSSYYEQNDGYNTDFLINRVLNGMGFKDFDRERRIDSLSGGEQTRLALAKLLLQNPELLILDEPTNHLDFETLDWLEDYLKSYKGAIIVVSHDRFFLDKLCSRTAELENKQLNLYRGGYSAYQRQKEQGCEAALKAWRHQQDEIKKLNEYIAKNKVRASTAAMAKSREKELSRMKLLAKPFEYKSSVKLKLEYDIEPPKELLKVENLSVLAGEKELLGSVSFELRRGDKVGIVGKNGAGKSTLLKQLLGKIPKTVGKIRWADNVKTFYFDQQLEALQTDDTVMETLHSRFPALDDGEIRRTLSFVLFSGEDVFKPSRVLSGGERVKLAFAVMILERANVLLLDEPTNHLDLNAREILENALSEYTGTVILVSHDRYLLNKIAGKIFELSGGRLGEYDCRFDKYRELVREQAARHEAQKAEEKAQAKKLAAKKTYRTKQQRAEDVKKAARIKEIEKLAAALEDECRAISEQMTDDKTASDYQKLSELCRTLEENRRKIAELEDEWLELSE